MAEKKAKKPKPPNPRRYWAASFALTVITLWFFGRATWHQPTAPWRIYQWGVLLTVIGAGMWLKTSRQRKRPYGDKAVAFWVWHWFTGARLTIYDNPDLPWWQDVRRCWPFLDTTPSEPCPCGKDRLPCLARRAATGLARTALTAGLILAEYLRSGAPDGYGPRAVVTWGLGGTVALCLFAIAVAWLTIQGAMWLWWIHPLHCALTVGDTLLAGHPPNKRPRSWIKITRAWENGRRGVLVKLPLWFKQHQENIDKTQQATLNVCELDPAKVNVTWELGGAKSYLLITPAETLPNKVSFANLDVRKTAAQAATRYAPVFGATHSWVPVSKSVKTDNPHILIAGRTRMGKTVAVMTILFWLLIKNRDRKPSVDVFDPKLGSVDELEDLACVRYFRDLDAIADRLVELHGELKRRAAEGLDYKREHGQPKDFDPIYVVFDDINSAVEQMQANKRRYGPALTAWRTLLNMSAFVAIHIIACPQDPRHDALGGGRSQFGIIVLMSGYDQRTWNKVAQDLEFEELEARKGRAMIICNGDRIPTQLMWDERGEMPALLFEAFGRKPVEAVGGRRVGPPQGSAGVGAPLASGAPSPDDAGVMAASPQPQPPAGPPQAPKAGTHPPGPEPTTDPLAPTSHSPSQSRFHVPGAGNGEYVGITGGGDVPPGPDLVTLRDAYNRRPEFFGVQYDSVKRARRRDKKARRWPVHTVIRGNTDDGEGDQYHWPDVVRWWTNRPRSEQKRAKVDWVVYSIVPGGRSAVRVGADVKVGYTGNIEERCKTLAERIEHVVKLEHFPTKAAAYAREQELHREFWRQRKSTDPSYEVFAIWGPVADYLSEFLVEEVPA